MNSVWRGGVHHDFSLNRNPFPYLGPLIFLSHSAVNFQNIITIVIPEVYVPQKIMSIESAIMYCTTIGPLSITRIKFNVCIITPIIRCGLKLLIHSKRSTVKPFIPHLNGNRVAYSCITLIRVSKRVIFLNCFCYKRVYLKRASGLK